MEDNFPRRRGRPPMSAQSSESAMLGESAPQQKRRRRAPLTAMQLKLSAPQRPGFVRRWFNDDGNRIAEAEELAYEHVTEGGVQSSDTSSRVSRLVGTKANGEPLRAYLMETPVEEYEHGVREREAIARQVDEAIAAGRDSTGQMDSNETYGRGSIQRDR